MFILAAMPHSVAVTLVPPLAEMPFDALLDSARIQAGPPPESEAIERAEMFMDAVLVKTRASRSASGVVTVTCTAWLPSPVGEAISAAATCEARMPCAAAIRSEEHTSELQSLMRISYAVVCLKKKNNRKQKMIIVNKRRT